MNQKNLQDRIYADCMKQRPTCNNCRKAISTCYCHRLKPFLSPVDFVILQHPKEARNTVATARMAHLSIINSKLIAGLDFSKNSQVNALISDQTKRNFVLYPGPHAISLAEVFSPAIEDPRPLAFWVIDGKWAQIPKMLRLSSNVSMLPMVRFHPTSESQFEIREQPRPEYLSTIETIHFVIDSFKKHCRSEGGNHHALIDTFRHLVSQQIGFVDIEKDSRHRLAKAARAARRARLTL